MAFVYRSDRERNGRDVLCLWSSSISFKRFCRSGPSCTKCPSNNFLIPDFWMKNTRAETAVTSNCMWKSCRRLRDIKVIKAQKKHDIMEVLLSSHWFTCSSDLTTLTYTATVRHHVSWVMISHLELAETHHTISSVCSSKDYLISSRDEQIHVGFWVWNVCLWEIICCSSVSIWECVLLMLQSH